MKKLLLILSISVFTVTSISNLNNVTYKLNNNLHKNINNKTITNSQTNDFIKLENWHNSLNIEQDAQAKQGYLDSMIIKTTKTTSANNFDTYNIVLDNIKLKNMLKNKLINQDVYNVWQNVNTAQSLTMEANSIVTLPTKSNSNIKVRAFQSQFYIENNKMHFVDKDNANPYKINLQNILVNKNVGVISPNDAVLFVCDWFINFKIEWSQAYTAIDCIIAMNNNDYTVEEIEQWFLDYVIDLINAGATELLEFIMVAYDDNSNSKTNNLFSKYFFLNSIEKYLKQIKAASDKYHTGASEDFYFYGLYMDPNSIKPIPPMTKTSEINNEDKASYFNRGKKITNEYDNVPLLDYNGYDSLWQYLNTQGEAFNLNKIFKSYVGILGKYNNLNYTFHHLEATSILKPYLNTWITVTKASWTNYNWETSLAQMQMMISDNPWTKTVEFNFKSILCNVNTFDSVGNEMFY